MEKIKKYIQNFFSEKNVNRLYDMDALEWITLSNEAERDSINTVHTVFNYGYAKGYRAAMAEIKKGGVTA